MECMEELNKDVKKEENDRPWTSGWEDQITTGAKLLDIKYEHYGFSGDLIEAMN